MKLINIVKELYNKDVEDYFKYLMEKVYVTKRYNSKRSETTSYIDYLNKRYKDSCYYYSAYALMGLDQNDYIIRGKIDIDEQGYNHYYHGWIEFLYQGKYYVFDSLLPCIVPKNIYYLHYRPLVTYKKTLKDVIDIFIQDEVSKRIDEGIYKINDYSLVYNDFNIDHSHLYLPYSNATIELDEEKYVRTFNAFK